MNTICQPLPRTVVEEMLQVAARAICDRPGDTPQQKASRTRQMVYSILGFAPRDALEYMVATMVVGHFHLILDSMRLVFQGQMDSVKARTKTGIVSLDRAMLAFVKELRLSQHRPIAQWAEDTQKQAGPPETPEWVAAWAGLPESPPAAPEPEAAIEPTASMPAAEAPTEEAARSRTKSAPAQNAPLPESDRSADPAQPENHPTDARPAVISHPGPTAPTGRDTTKDPIAAFEEALAGLAKRLETEQLIPAE